MEAPTPDENTSWLFREKLTCVDAIGALFVAFDLYLRTCGFQSIADAIFLAAPEQRDITAIKANRSGAETVSDSGPAARKP
ncbi:hypothetical protein QLH51_17300 [Sphingomonas sp. 2R-10]|uniref:hypothetical protein n=1 Tax=Sphingomonas sp. 2R-10 TaxID=3045148 RepID=UPI0013DE0400|nr:hypothetical protein [Sphingomonas sp. 2R-10]MDJ0278555.1 hypothetical protein [Sphingomonas sp. 2R-10]